MSAEDTLRKIVKIVEEQDFCIGTLDEVCLVLEADGYLTFDLPKDAEFKPMRQLRLVHSKKREDHE